MDIGMVDVFGWTASIITIIYTAIGLPAQIIKNFKAGTASGLSLFLFVFLFLTFTSWVVYGIFKPDWFIVVPNGLGAICAFILVCQILYYNRIFKSIK
ncbi:MAG TPA: SemiSWEET family transporter [Victivallales bacterium]|nr:SemiSWEET family transporter [Victivallales bacterium]